jgi:hypothetical protein
MQLAIASRKGCRSSVRPEVFGNHDLKVIDIALDSVCLFFCRHAVIVLHPRLFR